MDKKWFAPLFWAVSVLVAVLGAIGGARWGASQAPTFAGGENDGAPATSVSHLIYSVFGAVICGLAALAIASGVFFLIWARSRRHGPVENDDRSPQDMDLSEVEDLFSDEGRA